MTVSEVQQRLLDKVHASGEGVSSDEISPRERRSMAALVNKGLLTLGRDGVYRLASDGVCLYTDRGDAQHRKVIPLRLTDDEISVIDTFYKSAGYKNRTAFVRSAIGQLMSQHTPTGVVAASFRGDALRAVELLYAEMLGTAVGGSRDNGS